MHVKLNGNHRDAIRLNSKMNLERSEPVAASIAPYLSSIAGMLPSFIDHQFRLCRGLIEQKDTKKSESLVGGSPLTIPDYMCSLKPVFAVLDCLLKLESLCQYQEEFTELLAAAFSHFNTHHIQPLASGPQQVIC